jgi:hypothetical protein
MLTFIYSTITPAVTTFSSAMDNHAAGDVLFTLPDDLAQRMAEMIQRSSECTDGDNFDHGNQRRAGGSGYGAAICGAEAVLNNAIPGAAFAEFRVLRPGPLPFGAADAVRAMNTVVHYARTLAQALALTPEQAAAVAVAAGALALNAAVFQIPIGTANVVPASSLTGSLSMPSMSITSAPSTTTTTASCSPTSDCYADCKMVGNIKKCWTTCNAQSTAPCEAGRSKKLLGNGITTTSVTPWTVVAENIPTPTPTSLQTQCIDDTVSGLLNSAFLNVFNKFCSDAGQPSDGITWIVDMMGNQIQNAKRDSDFAIGLTWTPGQNSGTSCAASCSDAYKALANSSCEFQNIPEYSEIARVGELNFSHEQADTLLTAMILWMLKPK